MAKSIRHFQFVVSTVIGCTLLFYTYYIPACAQAPTDTVPASQPKAPQNTPSQTFELTATNALGAITKAQNDSTGTRTDLTLATDALSTLKGHTAKINLLRRIESIDQAKDHLESLKAALGAVPMGLFADTDQKLKAAQAHDPTLNSDLAELNRQKDALTAAFGALTPASDPQKSAYEAAISKLNATIADVAGLRSSINTAQTNFAAASAILDFKALKEGDITSLADLEEKVIEPIKQLKKDSPSSDAQATLPTVLPLLADWKKRQLSQGWKALAQQIDIVRKQEIPPAIETKLKSNADIVKGAVTDIGTLLGKINTDIDTQNGKTEAARTDVLTKPSNDASLAVTQQQQNRRLLTSCDVLIGQFDLLPSDLAPTERLASFRASVQNLRDSDTRLKETLLGNVAEWVSDQISLYYFPDVERIMKVLNSGTTSNVRDPQARSKATDARTALTRADLDVIDARTEVSNAQRRLQEIQEEQRQAQANFASFDKIVTLMTRSLSRLQTRQTTAQTALATAQSAHEAAPNDPIKQAAFDKAKREKDDLDSQVQKSTDQLTDNQKDRTDAEQRVNALKQEKGDLPTRLQNAKDRLQQAQNLGNETRRQAILRAQEENEAFAKARDSSPFFSATPVPGSIDPALRVQMYAYPDSKTIFLRGKREDVDRVKEIISLFDLPVPQARLTLWTLELNSEASREGAKKFNQALKIVEDVLSRRRIQIAACLSILRDCINKEVKVAVDSCKDAKCDPKEKRFHLYASEFRTSRSFLLQGGFDLPDPAGTTTLGEALMVLSMADHSHKAHILQDVERRIREEQVITSDAPSAEELRLAKRQRLAHEPVEFLDLPKPNDTKRPGITPDGTEYGRVFVALNRALGLFTKKGNVSDADLCPAQLEILRALRRVAQERLVTRYSDNWKRLVKIGQVLAPKLQSSDDKKFDADTLQLLAERLLIIKTLNDIETKLSPDRVITAIHTSYQAKFVRFKEAYDKLFGSNSKETITKEIIASETQHIPEIMAYHEAMIKDNRQRYPAETANARVAAADQMLKELIIAIEDDLDRRLVAPMLNGLRSTLLQKRIGVGVLQRTSVLASNRLVARVDPRASGELPVGEEQNVLQATQQLAQLYLTAQTTGVIGTLGALDALPHDQPPVIYGVTTGSAFQVTPVIDPSGQALRFKFDYVSASQIREPNDTVNPQLPRIERHSVNTEVQLSNLELRNISQFDSNVRLGLPTQRTGGFPILKDINFLKDVPLIGWFSRKSSRSALIQQSLIFAQTAIYPTIGDITRLLASETSSQTLLQEDNHNQESHGQTNGQSQ